MFNPYFKAFSYMPFRVFIISLFFFLPFLGLAHGDLDERIEAVTEELNQNPNDSDLLLKRGKLYYQHAEYMKSIRDYEKAESLGASRKIVLQGYAEAWLELGQADFALENIDQLINIAPQYHQAHQIKGDIYMNMKQFDAATRSYRENIDLTKEKNTLIYHNLLTALDSIDTDQSRQESILIVHEALAALGRITAFQNKLIDLLITTDQHIEAISQLDEIIEASQRKERHYLKRAKINVMLNDQSSAQQDLKMSIASIESLPIRIRQSKKMVELQAEIKKLQN